MQPLNELEHYILALGYGRKKARYEKWAVHPCLSQ